MTAKKWGTYYIPTELPEINHSGLDGVDLIHRIENTKKIIFPFDEVLRYGYDDCVTSVQESTDSAAIFFLKASTDLDRHDIWMYMRKAYIILYNDSRAVLGDLVNTIWLLNYSGLYKVLCGTKPVAEISRLLITLDFLSDMSIMEINERVVEKVPVEIDDRIRKYLDAERYTKVIDMVGEVYTALSDDIQKFIAFDHTNSDYVTCIKHISSLRSLIHILKEKGAKEYAPSQSLCLGYLVAK